MKLFFKYSALLATLLLLSVGSVTTLALLHHRQALTREALLRAESIAVNLALISADAILTRNVLQLVPLTTDATTRHEAVVYAAVVDRDGLVLAHPDRAAVKHPLDFKPAGEQSTPDIQAEVLAGTGMGVPVWDVSVPVRAKGTLVDLGRVHVGLDQRSVQASVAASLRQLVLVSVACLTLGLGAAFLAIRYLVRPLQTLSAAAVRVGQGDFSQRVPLLGNDELGELAAHFNQMVEGLGLAEARKREAQRLEGELQVARSIQKDLLPALQPDLPGWETAFACEPAKELGGDYYDWYPVAGGAKTGIIVADVAGKGVPAALHMANLRNLFRFITQDLESPAAVLKRVNALAYPDLRSESFMTLIYGVLDPASGRFTYVNAGHDPLLWAHASGGVDELGSSAFPVGIVDADEFDPKVSEFSIQLAPGDLLCGYTDGITEAADAQSVQFGIERIKATLAGRGAQAVVDSLREQLAAYLAGRAPDDDVTLVAVRWRPQAAGAVDGSKQRRV